MRSLRILVVDDSGLTVKKMAKLLEELGHRVVGMASTGQQAVDVYAEAAPEIGRASCRERV